MNDGGMVAEEHQHKVDRPAACGRRGFEYGGGNALAARVLSQKDELPNQL